MIIANDTFVCTCGILEFVDTMCEIMQSGIRFSCCVPAIHDYNNGSDSLFELSTSLELSRFFSAIIAEVQNNDNGQTLAYLVEGFEDTDAPNEHTLIVIKEH